MEKIVERRQGFQREKIFVDKKMWKRKKMWKKGKEYDLIFFAGRLHIVQDLLHIALKAGVGLYFILYLVD